MAVSFSIVTPCLNSEATIAQTLRSVRTQDVEGLEHVIIDGGSTDGTLDILRAADGPVMFISEPDNGLSEAVNKGIRMARNDVIGWLNADDVYLSGALRRVQEGFEAPPPPPVAAGGCPVIDAARTERPRGIKRH